MKTIILITFISFLASCGGGGSSDSGTGGGGGGGGTGNGQVVVWDQALSVNNAWTFNFAPSGGIANLKSPVDFTQGKIHLKLVFTSIPGVPVYYRIQFYPSNYASGNPTHYWTDPLNGPVNAVGTFDTEYNFSALQHGGADWADWTHGIYQLQYSTYDSGNNGINVNYNVHITVTLIPPGATYMPTAGG